MTVDIVCARRGLYNLQPLHVSIYWCVSWAQLEMVDKMQTGTRQYAHRQIKWARGVELFQWLDAQQETSEIVDQIVNSLNGPPYTGTVATQNVCTIGLCSWIARILGIQGLSV